MVDLSIAMLVHQRVSHVTQCFFSVSREIPAHAQHPGPGVQQDEVPRSIPLGAQYHTLAHGVNLGKSGRIVYGSSVVPAGASRCLKPPPFHPQLHIHGIWLVVNVVSFNHLEK